MMKTRTTVFLSVGLLACVFVAYALAQGDRPTFQPKFSVLETPPVQVDGLPSLVRALAPDGFDVTTVREIGPKSLRHAYVARGLTPLEEICLVVPADGGYGGGCASPTLDPRMHGLSAVAVLNRDGTQTVTALVPDGVIKVDTPSGSLTPERSAVVFSIRPGESDVVLHSAGGEQRVSLEGYNVDLPAK